MGERKFDIGDVVRLNDPKIYGLIVGCSGRGYKVLLRVEKDREYDINTKRMESLEPLEAELIKNELFGDVELDE